MRIGKGAGFFAVAIFCAGTALPVMAEQAKALPPVKDFARFPDYEQLKLSPKGDYLAVTSRIESRTVLAILRLSDLKIVASAGGAEYQHVNSFDWVSDERVVYSIAENYGSLEVPYLTGELMALDVDGSPSKYLFGYRGEMSTGTRIRGGKAEYASARLIDPLLDEPNYALIAVYPWQDSAGQINAETVYKINVRNGMTTPVVSAPGRGFTQFATDQSGFVRFAAGAYRQAYSVDTYIRSPEEPRWRQLDDEDGASGGAEVEALDGAAQTVYMKSGSCLVSFRLNSKERERLACSPTAEVFDIDYSHDGLIPIRASFEPGKIESVSLAEQHPDSRLLRALERSFPGQYTHIVSWSRDGSKAIISASSDRNPGTFYLFDRQAKKAEFLLAKESWIDAEQMAERQPISFAAADGMTIYGYLTLPRGEKPQQLPMVVLPHGGPFGPQDHWFYDDEAQMFASRGYAVLQVNFRGSGGYGKAYLEAGKGKWGSAMIDDIATGTRYVIGKGVADAGRICIYGGSFGGYAAMMSAVRYPELYRCAIGYAGAYDLLIQRKESDTANTRIGRDYLNFFVGADEAKLKEQSPISHLDRLRAAVMLVHGEQDRRVPFSQFKAMRDALKARNYPFESLTYAGEGHGFYSEAHREEFYTKMLDFIARSLSAPASESASTTPGAVTP